MTNRVPAIINKSATSEARKNDTASRQFVIDGISTLLMIVGLLILYSKI